MAYIEKIDISAVMGGSYQQKEKTGKIEEEKEEGRRKKEDLQGEEKIRVYINA